MNNPILSLLSLCNRAGKLKSGEFAAERALQDGSAKLVIVAEDASGNTKKKFCQKAFYYQVPYMEWGEKMVLGTAIGKNQRSAMVIIDTGFAEKISLMLKK